MNSTTENAHIPTKEKLIVAGINILQEHGLQGFSLRKIASACNISCAATYKHFRDKDDLIKSIVDYINEQWHKRQVKIIEKYAPDTRKQLIEISLEYIRFLVENPHFRSVLMIKDSRIQNIYNQYNISTLSKQLIQEYCTKQQMPKEREFVKTFIVLSLIHGAAMMFANGEIEYNDKNFLLISQAIEREFDLA